MNASLARFFQHSLMVRNQSSVAVLIAILSSATANAQGVVRYRPATAYSADILASAAYLQAQGNLLVSAANAREVNARAAEQEAKNSVTWVQTYFERRRLNREAREAEHIDFMEFREQRYAQWRKLMEIDPDIAISGNIHDDMNWLLKDLIANVSYSMFFSGLQGSLGALTNGGPPGGANLPVGAADMPLNAGDVHHLRLREAKGAQGAAIAFRADTVQVLETRWPKLLRDDQFAAARTSFEKARDEAISELKNKKAISSSVERRLMDAVDRLTEEFNAAHPEHEQGRSPQVFMTYLPSKRYLQTLAMSTFRLIEARSDIAFDESYRFVGKTLGELIQHLAVRSLEFAPPEPGDEGVYRKVFFGLRDLHKSHVPMPTGK